jgi:hypothetical protein
MSEPNDNHDTKLQPHPLSPEAAREQAAEYWGIKTFKEYDVGNGEKLTLPHPEFLDDDQQLAHDQLKLDMESWDHEDELEHDALGQIVLHPKTGDAIIHRVLKSNPHRKTGEDGKVELKNYNIELCKIFWGAEGYAKFKAAGGNANQVAVDLSELRIEFQKRARERLQSDPKRR